MENTEFVRYKVNEIKKEQELLAIEVRLKETLALINQIKFTSFEGIRNHGVLTDFIKSSWKTVDTLKKLD